MDPLTDLLRQQRGLTPPSGSVDELERNVMSRLDHPPGARRRRLLMGASVSLGCVCALLILLVVTRPRVAPPPSPDFVESVVMLDGHTSIWLEFADPQSSTGRAHE